MLLNQSSRVARLVSKAHRSTVSRYKIPLLSFLLIFTDKEKLATSNKHESRVSTNKPLPPLPALPKTEDAYFEYMFSDAMDGETIHEDEEVEIAGLEYESRKCQLLSYQF